MRLPIENNGYVVAIDEHRAIIERCKKALLDAVRDATFAEDGLRYAPQGWKYSWTAEGRDRLNNLLVTIRVHGPTKQLWRVQRVRLIKAQRLPRELRMELRER